MKGDGKRGEEVFFRETVGCGKCHVACEDTAHQAIAIEPGRRYTVIEEECVGCNLCSHVCPVPGCITMVDDTRGKPFESWNDRIAKGTNKVPGGLHD